MTYLLDTDTCIYYLKGQAQAVKRLTGFSPDKVKIPAIVLGELMEGAWASHTPRHTLDIVQAFCSAFDILSFNEDCALVYGRLRYELRTKGEMIGPNDVLIAAMAIATNATLVTHNTKEFGRIKDLKCLDPLA